MGVLGQRGRIGAHWEREAMRELEKEGWYVMRSAASAGPCDLIAWNDLDIRFIQVKRASNMGSLYDARHMAKKGMRSVPRAGGASFELWIRINREWVIEKL